MVEERSTAPQPKTIVDGPQLDAAPTAPLQNSVSPPAPQTSSSPNPGVLCGKVIPLIGGKPMDSLPQLRLLQSRRDILKSGALAVVPLAILFRNLALQDQQPMIANGGADRFQFPC